MANIAVDLPFPVLNGAGAAVNTSAMGSLRTIVCIGSFPGATITIEGSVDGGATYGPICTFKGAEGSRTLKVAVEFMRVNVSGRKALVPFAANCDVAANDDGCQFASVPLPVLNGPGAQVDVSLFGKVSTVVASGDFGGATIVLEASDDGTDWTPIGKSFAGAGGLLTFEVLSSLIRARVSGRKATVPFTATIAMGAANDPSAGGGYATSNNVFIYRPAGTADPTQNVFTTWASLMTAYALVEGPKVIEMDDNSVSPCVIPSGNWVLGIDCTWRGVDYGHRTWPNRTVVSLSDGAVFDHPPIFEGLIVECNSSSTPFTLSANDRVILRDTDLSSGTGADPMFDFSTGFASVWFELLEYSTLGKYDPEVPVINIGAAYAGVNLNLYSNSHVYEWVISGVANSTLNCNQHDSSAIVEDQAAGSFSGNLLYNSYDRTDWNMNPSFLSAPSTSNISSAQMGQWLRLNCTAGPITQVLPEIKETPAPGQTAPLTPGQTVVVTETSGLNPVIIDGDSGETIEGEPTYELQAGHTVLLISDGVSNWRVVGLDQNKSNEFLAAQGSRQVDLTDGGSVDVDASLGNLFFLRMTDIVGGIREIHFPTNLVAGFTYMFVIANPTTASGDPAQDFTFETGAGYYFPGGVAPTSTGALDSIDIITMAAVDLDGVGGGNIILVDVSQADFQEI